MIKIATQIFGLEKELTADLSGTIEKLHGIGFDAIEPFILFRENQGNAAKNLWSLDTLKIASEKMRELDMTMPSVHIGIGYGWLAIPISTIVRNILKLHESYSIDKFVVSGTFNCPGEAKHWANLTRKISNEVHAHGCTILYHNHDDEFNKVRFKGKTVNAMDVFLDQTSPNVLLQVDIGWAGLAEDDLHIMERYADRIASIHLKDFHPNYMSGYNRKNMPAEAFALIGEGGIHIKEIISMVNKLPNFAGTVIIDQDKYSGDMLEALEIGCKNILSIIKE